MGDAVTWNHLKKIAQMTGQIDKILEALRLVFKDYDEFKRSVVDNPTLKANLKEALKVHPKLTIESVVADYQKLTALKQYLINEGLL